MLSHFSHVRPFATPWTVACQVPLSMDFSRQKYWKGLLCLSPGDLPDLRITLTSLVASASQSRFFTTESLGKPKMLVRYPRVQLFSDAIYLKTEADSVGTVLKDHSAYDTSDKPRLLPMFLTIHQQLGNYHYPLKLKMPITSPSFCLYFWPTGCKSEIPTVIWKLSLLLGECWVRRYKEVKE